MQKRILMKIPERTKPAMFQFNRVPKRNRAHAIWFANLIRDTTAWKGASRAIDALVKRKGITPEFGVELKQGLFEAWRKSDVMASFFKGSGKELLPAMNRKTLSKSLSKEIFEKHIMLLEGGLLMKVITDKKELNLFYDRKKNLFQFITTDLKE